MLRLLSFLLVMVLFCQCGPRKVLQIAMEDQEDFRYLALGDSYTIGESVAPSKTYPELLANELRSRGVPIKRPQIVATTGWTTTDLAKGIQDTPVGEFEFDMVSLLVGVNDQYQQKPFEDYEQNFRKLLETAIALAGGHKERVFVLSIPDYSYTPFGQKKDANKISEEIMRYNQVNRQVAEENEILYFDITPISQKGLSEPDLVATDGLHPSELMYREWVDLMAEIICDRFK